MAGKNATYDDALYWTVKDVGNWLERIGFHEYKEPLRTDGIDGKELFGLSENRLRRLYPTRNMPTGKNDPAAMLWKQINKVKENRRTGKKSKNPFGWNEKRPPKAPEPDYKPPQTNRQNDQGSEDDSWGSDFSDDNDNAAFEQADDSSTLQGNTQGRTVSYNGSSTSSFTNLSSSASGKEEDSSMYLAPNTEGDFDQTYEVPSEQMNSSYGDGDCDEIYDVPHDEEESNQQPFSTGFGGRSVSPLPQVMSPRHEPLRPLPTPPPSQQPSWQQQQQHPSQMLELPGRSSPRRPASPRHFPRPQENDRTVHKDEEQENYEVPSIEEPEQSEYEAPMMDAQEDEEEEYLVADTSRGFKARRLPNPPPSDSVGVPLMTRPQAPLPPTCGGRVPPPRPEKPRDLLLSLDDAPPIPTRPFVPRSPKEMKGFTTKVLPDPTPQAIRNIGQRTSVEPSRGDPVFGNSYNMNSCGSEDVRSFSQPPPLPSGSTVKPPPLPKNILQDTMDRSKDSTSANSNGSVFKMRNKFQMNTTEEPENKRPQIAPRPMVKKPDLPTKPSTGRPSWQKPTTTHQQDVNPPLSPQSRPTLKSDEERGSHLPKLPAQPQPHQPQPQPSPRVRISEPPIPVKDQPKIKKYTPHAHIRGHPDPKKSEPKEERTIPVVPKKGDMTGYPWYDAELSREGAIQILKETKKDGAFVVRNSTKPDPTIPYSLSLWFNNKPRNLHIRLRDDAKYALGKFKDNEQVFVTPVLLIQHHMTTPLILAGDAGKTCLKMAAPNFR